MKNLNREERLTRKFNYIKNLYESALEDISEVLINLCNIDLDIQFKDDINYLIKIDQEIHRYKKAIKCCYERNKNYDDCKELFFRLSLVHKAIYEVMKTEYNIISCREDEKGRLEYVQC